MLQQMREYRKYILPFTIAVFLLALFLDSEKTLGFLKGLLAGLSFLSSRFIIGFVIAYVMNYLVSFLRKRLRFPDAAAITLSYLVFFGLVAVLAVFIVPMVTESASQITALVGSVPKYYNNLQAWLEERFTGLDEEVVAHIITYGQNASKAALTALEKLLDFSVWENVLRTSTRLLSNIFFAIVISIYALGERRSLAKATRRLLYALLPIRKARAAIEFVKESNRIFSQYLIAQLLDSLLVGAVSAAAYAVFDVPQAGFFAIIAGVTNMIPYFGPIVGGAITVLILLFYNPWAALTALIIIVVIQTIDGWYFSPKILGNAVGLSPLLAIIAITLGGDLFGFTGIFLGVPAVAVVKTMIYDRYIARKLIKRQDEAAETLGDDIKLLEIYDVLDKEQAQNLKASKKDNKSKKDKPKGGSQRKSKRKR